MKYSEQQELPMPDRHMAQACRTAAQTARVNPGLTRAEREQRAAYYERMAQDLEGEDERKN